MIDENLQDVIFVGLPGPTHHYGGLSADNVASSRNRGSESRPREAALQALELARALTDMGMTVGILPPQARPYMPGLREHFNGSDEAVIAQAARENPLLLEQFSSSSAMWAANAATALPGVDCADGLLHIGVANLQTNLHRRIEANDTYRMLREIFAGVPGCAVHPPLATSLPDEGAANHMRLAPRHGAPGLNVFVYGRGQARQQLQASQAIAAQASARHPLFIEQNPDVIRQGVFHNDVIAVSNEQLLLAHEAAYARGRDDIAAIADAFEVLHPGNRLASIVIRDAELSVAEAVQSYFFNSQIITKPDGGMAIIAPLEVKEYFGGKGLDLMDAIRCDPGNPVDEVRVIDLRQSMRNGGGPACLRLRVPMTAAQLTALKASVNVMADEASLAGLEGLVRFYYPETFQAHELGDPAVYRNCSALVNAVMQKMRLGLTPER